MYDETNGQYNADNIGHEASELYYTTVSQHYKVVLFVN